MADIKEAEKKLIFAEYLIRRPDSASYLPAASKHLLIAANVAIQCLTNIDEKRASSPQMVMRALEKFEEKQVTSFSKFYMDLWKSLMNPLSPSDAVASLNTVKAFVEWVKKQK